MIVVCYSLTKLQKHFQYVRRGYNFHDKTKLEIFSQTNNTQMGHCKKSAVTRGLLHYCIYLTLAITSTQLSSTSPNDPH